MPFYADSDGVGVRIPTLGEQLPPLYSGGFAGYAMAVVVAGDDTGNSSANYGAVPDTAPAATSDTDADILVDTQEAFDIFNIEASAAEAIWVTSVSAAVMTAWTASVTLTMGDTDNAQGWAEAAMFGATTTDQGLTVPSTGSASVDTSHIYWINHGRLFAASSAHIGATIAGADPAAGRLAVFAQYARVFRAGA